MKQPQNYMIVIIIGLLSSFIYSCDESEKETDPQENSIYGTWQLFEEYTVSGVTGNWSKIHDGYQFSIKPNNTFNSSKFQECSNGIVDINETQIVFKYECEGFTTGIESPTGEFSYNYSFVEKKLSLNPNFLSCDEGCGYRFLKVD